MLETPSIPVISPHRGDQASRPWEGIFRCPALTQFGVGDPPFAEGTEGCCAGQAWRSHVAAGSRSALERVGVPRSAGHTKAENIICLLYTSDAADE